MKSYNAYVLTLASLVLSLAVAGQPVQDDQAAQDAKATEGPQVEPRYVTVEDIEGAELRIPAGVPGEEPKKDAEVQDVLIETESGELAWALVKVGGRRVLVPCAELRWDVAEECFATERGRAELEALPEFDPKEAKKNGLQGAVAIAERGWREHHGDAPIPGAAGKEAVEASAPRTLMNPRYRPSSERYFHASELDELELYCGTEEFGGVTRSIVDIAGHRVAFFVVSRGGVLGVGDVGYLIPFETACICKSTEKEDAEPALCTDHTVQQLEAAVRYEKPEEGVLDPAQATRARSSIVKGVKGG